MGGFFEWNYCVFHWICSGTSTFLQSSPYGAVAKAVLVTQQCFGVAEQCQTLFSSSPTETGRLGMAKRLGGDTGQQGLAHQGEMLSHHVVCSGIKAQGRRQKGHSGFRCLFSWAAITVLWVSACLGVGEHLPPDGEQGALLYLHTQFMLFPMNLPLSHSTSVLAFFLFAPYPIKEGARGRLDIWLLVRVRILHKWWRWKKLLSLVCLKKVPTVLKGNFQILSWVSNSFWF